jgi:hypothetical protein
LLLKLTLDEMCNLLIYDLRVTFSFILFDSPMFSFTKLINPHVIFNHFLVYLLLFYPHLLERQSLPIISPYIYWPIIMITVTHPVYMYSYQSIKFFSIILKPNDYDIICRKFSIPYEFPHN